MFVTDLLLNSDSPVPHQTQFVQPDTAFGEDAMYPYGVSSICETDPDTETGAMFILVVCFLLLASHINEGIVNKKQSSDTTTFGAGIAQV